MRARSSLNLVLFDIYLIHASFALGVPDTVHYSEIYSGVLNETNMVGLWRRLLPPLASQYNRSGLLYCIHELEVLCFIEQSRPAYGRIRQTESMRPGQLVGG